jgi:hypothetical protein
MKTVLLYAALAAAVLLCLLQTSRVTELKSKNNRLSVELAHAQIPLQRDTIRDTIEVVTQTVVEVVPKKLKEALAEQAQTIKDLRLKVRQLESAQTTAIEISDSVPAQYSKADNKYHYSDQWADIELSLKDSIFYYNIRDSLATYVYRDYKHRFLWWRWGLKGYHVKIANFNPNASVKYNKYIKAER